MSGNDIDNTAYTGPIKVVVRQDGIGRTGGIVLGVFAGMAFGVAVLGFIFSLKRQDDVAEHIREEVRVAYDALQARTVAAETKAALVERRYIDMESYALLNGWKVPKDDQHGPLGNLERLKGDDHVRR